MNKWLLVALLIPVIACSQATRVFDNLSELRDTQITDPSSGQVLKWNGEKWVNGSVTSAANGTVTSVAVTGSNGISISGSPITSAGTINIGLANDVLAIEQLSGTGWAKRVGNDSWVLVTPAISDITGLQAALSGSATAAITALSSLTPALNKLPYFTGTNTASATSFTAFARQLLALNTGTNATIIGGLITWHRALAIEGADQGRTPSIYFTYDDSDPDNILYNLHFNSETGTEWGVTFSSTLQRNQFRQGLGITVDGFTGAFSSLGSKPTTRAGYGITDAQPLDTELTAIAATTSGANKLPYFTGSGTAATTTITSHGRDLIASSDAPTTLFLLDAPLSVSGTTSTNNSSSTLTFGHVAPGNGHNRLIRVAAIAGTISASAAQCWGNVGYVNVSEREETDAVVSSFSSIATTGTITGITPSVTVSGTGTGIIVTVATSGTANILWKVRVTTEAGVDAF